MLDDLGDVVECSPGFEIAEVARPDLEWLTLRRNAPARQPATQRLVHDLAERPPGAARFRLELGCDVIVQGKVVRIP